VTPNLAEAAAATGRSRTDAASEGAVTAVAEMAAQLLGSWQARAIAVTIGERGALLRDRGGRLMVFPPPHEVGGDMCGAGDCFASLAAVALAGGALPSEAVGRAVAGATAFLSAGGVAALQTGGDITGNCSDAVRLAEQVRAAGGTVVATGGCFDLLHAGHVSMLDAARRLGDCLIVCLNSDESVRRLKGDGRPLQSAADREHLLRALRAVDAVVVFDEDTPEAVLRTLRPHVWVKGDDYAATDLPEAAAVRSWGGEVVTVPYLSGRSTSALVRLSRG
jgi:rfaE bifunctional protein nucleotidyltransferase chain/domain